MKTTRIVPCIVGLSVAAHLFAQQFNPGSDGSFGDFATHDPTTSLALPPDGIVQCRSFVVNAGQSVKVVPNRANTPAYILSTGDIVINGTLDVSGSSAAGGTIAGAMGGAGGFRGGNGISDGQTPGPGHGPGGGFAATGPSDTLQRAGCAGYRVHVAGERDLANGAAYGSVMLIPLVGGSGGGGSWSGPGGGGGGAILLASATRVVIAGSVIASGGTAPDQNGGSGGAIRVVAPAISGDGILDVRGNAGASMGRIRLDTLDARVGVFQTPGTTASVGSLMLTGVNLPGAPRLGVVQVGTQPVSAGSSGVVTLTLPIGSNPQQGVVVEAANFGRKVPVTVALLPDNGQRVDFNADIDNPSGVTRSTIPVVFPVNVTTRVSVWTR